MRALRLMSVCLVACLFVVPAKADVSSFFDVFNVSLGGDAQNWNEVLPGSGGSGWSEDGQRHGDWIAYGSNPTDPSQTDPWGNTNPLPGWKNQWFYDGVYDPTRYKIVEVNFNYQLLDPLQNGGTDIVINWATPDWINSTEYTPNAPPMWNGPEQSPYVGRAVVGGTWLESGTGSGVHTFSGTFDLREYGVPFNPEWVSIDIAGYNIQLSDPSLPGSFNHYCIPEPGALVLMLTGGIGLLAYAWRRRR